MKNNTTRTYEAFVLEKHVDEMNDCVARAAFARRLPMGKGECAFGLALRGEACAPTIERTGRRSDTSFSRCHSWLDCVDAAMNLAYARNYTIIASVVLESLQVRASRAKSQTKSAARCAGNEAQNNPKVTQGPRTPPQGEKGRPGNAP